MRIALASCLLGVLLLACAIEAGPRSETPSEEPPGAVLEVASSDGGETSLDSGDSGAATPPEPSEDAGMLDSGTVWTGTGKTCPFDETCLPPVYVVNPQISYPRRCLRGYCVEEACSPDPVASKGCRKGTCRYEPSFFQAYCEVLR
jgi:hypothetical protein